MNVSGLVHQLFERQVELTPDRIAVEFADSSVTYGELNRRANRLAHHLIARGVKPDTLVGISMDRSIEMVVALYGVLKAGGGYIPLDADYPRDRLNYLIEDSKAQLVITQRIHSTLFSSDHNVLILDDGEDPALNEPDHNPQVEFDGSNMIYMYYTSGSTGKPKGVVNTHAGVANRVIWLQHTFEMGGNDKLLQKSPYSFDVSVWEFFWPLMAGARLVMALPGMHVDSGYLWKTISENEITHVQFVPTVLQTFLSEPELHRELPHLKHVFCCGEALSYSLQEQFFNVSSARLHNVYGPTETAIFVTHWECQRGSDRNIVPIGAAIPGNAMYVLNDDLQPVGDGEIGELFISGIGVARGYHNRPELTSERFVADPFNTEQSWRMYRTGDLGRWLPDGVLECLGRNDDQVKLRGYRVELGEISTVLEEHSGIGQSVTIMREDNPGDQRIVSYFIPAAGDSPSISELRLHMQSKLPEYMVPSFFVEMERFPLTPSGKTDRRALPGPMASRLDLGSYAPPETVTQKEVAAIWSSILAFDKIGLDDDFLDLGGHSLLGMQILIRLQQTMNVKITLRDMLTRGMTVRGLADLVEEVLILDANDGDLDELLSELEDLSDEEVAALLKEGVHNG